MQSEKIISLFIAISIAHHLIIYCDIDRTGDKDHHSSMKTASPIATNSGDADRLSDTAR